MGCFDNVSKKWDFLTQGSEADLFFTSPVAADFTLDNQKDVSGCYDPGQYWPPSPGAGDVTGDGIPDIFIHNGGTLFCVRGNDGGIEWQNTQTHLFGSPVVATLDQTDPELEIVVTGGPGTNNDRLKIELYEHTGVEKWQWYHPIGGSGFPDICPNEACLADIDNDNQLEIMGIDFSCYCVCLDCTPLGTEESNESPGGIQLMSTVFKNEVKLIVPKLDWLEYSVYDILGRLIDQGKFSQVADAISINLGKATRQGVYFLEIKTPCGSHKFKLVKLL